MIMVDTSVWIDFLGGVDNLQSNALSQALDDQRVAIGDLILVELLQGIRYDKAYKLTLAYLEELPCYDMLGRSIAIKSAENFRFMRKNGITIRRTTDVIIATFCIENDLPLLFSDKDFRPFVEHLGLLAV